MENSKNKRNNDEEKGKEEELDKDDDGKMNDPRIARPYNPKPSR